MNIIKFGTGFPSRQAINEDNKFRNRVLSNVNGHVVDSNARVELYRLFNSAGFNLLHGFSSFGGIQINTPSVEQVQTWYDLNNTSPANAANATSVNQPLWENVADVSHKTLTFSSLSVSRFLRFDDATMMQNKNGITVFTIARDTNKAGGDTIHHVVHALTNLGGFAFTIRTKSTTEIFQATGLRTTTLSSAVSQISPSLNGFNQISNRLDFFGGNLTINVNGLDGTPSAFAGSETVSNVVIDQIRIGSTNLATNRIIGQVSELLIFNNILSAEQNAALSDFYRTYYPTLP